MKKIKATRRLNSHGRIGKHTPSSQDVKMGRVTRGRVEKAARS